MKFDQSNQNRQPQAAQKLKQRKINLGKEVDLQYCINPLSTMGSNGPQNEI